MRSLRALLVAFCCGSFALACGDDSSAGDTSADPRSDTSRDPAIDPAADPNLDGAADVNTALDCESRAEANGWSFCGGTRLECSLVFADSTGCRSACAAVGLECVQSYDDVLGECDYQRDTAPLGCNETGHATDYCICGVGGTPDAGVDSGTDVSVDVPADTTERPAYEALLDELVGFGEGTTGGAGGPLVEVTNLNDSGAGSLREALTTPGPAWIRFTVSGVIDLESGIELTSDKTVDGRGADITIIGDGLFVQGGAGNVIINNIKMRDAEGDLLRFFDGGSQMWVHHCDLSQGGDGAFDATEGTTNVTISYTHIFDHDKTMLVGAGSDSGDGDGMRWTGHHNWYEDCVQRLPFIRFGRAHSFNNLFEWRSGTAMNVRLGEAQMLVENNILAPQTNVGHKVISESEGRGAVRFVGNLERPLSGDVIEFTEFMPETVFTPPYSYAAETADDALISRLRSEAGWQDVPFPE